ncbi:MAG: hypothetical protein IJ730_01285 [Alphaproteobacteria bacterium]|nr:hypothetical protein [Alphaproteobacteria bacterium]
MKNENSIRPATALKAQNKVKMSNFRSLSRNIASVIQGIGDAVGTKNGTNCVFLHNRRLFLAFISTFFNKKMPHKKSVRCFSDGFMKKFVALYILVQTEK